MSVKIAVRGFAERTYPAELARVALTIDAQGPERDQVVTTATASHTNLTQRLATLYESGAVQRWSADDVRVVAERPWSPAGERNELVQHARLSVRAEFADVEALGSFVAEVSVDDTVEVGSISWDVTPDNRKAFTAEVRAEAVADAVAKAQSYADAIGAGPVEATHLADPGLLNDDGPSPRVMMAMGAPVSDGPYVNFVPHDIVISCEVDARFKA